MWWTDAVTGEWCAKDWLKKANDAFAIAAGALWTAAITFIAIRQKSVTL
jgi:hypothetical protein